MEDHASNIAGAYLVHILHDDLAGAGAGAGASERSKAPCIEVAGELAMLQCYVKLDVAKRAKLRSYVAFTCSVASGKRSNILPTAGCFCNNVVLAGSRLKKSKMRVQTPVHE